MLQLEYSDDSEQSDHNIGERTLKQETAQAGFQEYQAANNMQANNGNTDHDDGRQ